MNQSLTRTASYVRLIDDPWVEAAVRGVSGLAEMTSHPPELARTLGGADAAVTVSFAVSALSEDGTDRFASALSVQSVHWPPLLMLARRPLAGWEQEYLRRQGVSAIIDVAHTSPRVQQIVDALGRSREWFGANITRAPLADLLQMLAADGRSGMLWIGCPHVRALSPRRWEESGSACTLMDESCPGWAARLHLQSGRLVFAETPTLTGVEALVAALALEEGYVRVHEVYMAPRRPNLDGTVQQLLIRAAALADERSRPSAPSATARPRPVTAVVKGTPFTPPRPISGIHRRPTASPPRRATSLRPFGHSEPAVGPAEGEAAPGQADLGPRDGAKGPLVEAAAASGALQATGPVRRGEGATRPPSPVEDGAHRSPPGPLSQARPPSPLSRAEGALRATRAKAANAPSVPTSRMLAEDLSDYAPPPLPTNGRPPVDEIPMVEGFAQPFALLGGEADLRLVVDTEDNGSVRVSAGDGDPDSVAAVSTLCKTAFDAAGEQFGLGALQSFCVVGRTRTLYAEVAAEGSRVAVGTASDNAFRLLPQVFKGTSS